MKGRKKERMCDKYAPIMALLQIMIVIAFQYVRFCFVLNDIRLIEIEKNALKRKRMFVFFFCAKTHLSRGERKLHSSLRGEQSVTRYSTVTNYIFWIIIAVVAFVITFFESPMEAEFDTLSIP